MQPPQLMDYYCSYGRALMVRPIQLSNVSPYRAWNVFLEEQLYLYFVFYTMQILNVVF